MHKVYWEKFRCANCRTIENEGDLKDGMENQGVCVASDGYNCYSHYLEGLGFMEQSKLVMEASGGLKWIQNQIF